jgi:hypothetical protein
LAILKIKNDNGEWEDVGAYGSGGSNQDNFDEYELITTEDIDAICGVTVQMANEEGVKF